MIRTEIKARLVEALRGLSLPYQEVNLELEVPSNPEFGDYASNIALTLGSEIGENPRELAKKIAGEVNRDVFASVDVEGPGFINFRAGHDLLTRSLQEILNDGPETGVKPSGEGQRLQVEFVSSNPTGPLTVGHGRQAVLGDILSSLYDLLGYDVHREYYFNDEGRQVKLLAESLWARYRQARGDDKSIPEEGYHGDYLIELGDELADKFGDEYPNWNTETGELFRQVGLKHMISTIKDDLTALGVEFDNWFRESSLHKEGQVEEVLEKLEEKDGIYKEDGATWLKAKEEGGPDDPVLVKSDGEPTYLLPDIAYHLTKLNRGFDKAVVLLGADHQRHVENMKAALSKLNFPQDFYEVHLNQFVSLKKGGQTQRMSTRKGNFITLRSLVEDLGKDVVRYFMAARRPESHLEFDYDLAKQESMDNPVYYLQYAHTRIAGIFRQPESDRFEEPVSLNALKELQEDAELELIKTLDRFPEVVDRAAKDFSPHALTEYAEDLAAQFHQFYNKYRVLSSDNDLSRARVALCQAVQLTMKSLLRLLGVSAPERM